MLEHRLSCFDTVHPLRPVRRLLKVASQHCPFFRPPALQQSLQADRYCRCRSDDLVREHDSSCSCIGVDRDAPGHPASDVDVAAPAIAVGAGVDEGAAFPHREGSG